MSEANFRLAILASGDVESGGGGSTANRVARDALDGKAAFDIGVVVCNNPEDSVAVYDLFDQINRDYGLTGDDHIDVVNISSITHPEGKQKRGQTLGESSAICRLFEEREIDFSWMLGYQKILSGEFVETWGWQPEYALDPTFSYREGLYHPDARIGNNHPAILGFTADTHSTKAHQKAIDLRDQGKLHHTAMTWHLASALVDKGPIIDEQPIEIEYGDDAYSLGEKVKEVEKEETATVIAKHLILRAEHQRANS